MQTTNRNAVQLELDHGCLGEGGRIMYLYFVVVYLQCIAVYLYYRCDTGSPTSLAFGWLWISSGFLVVQSPDVGLSFPRIHTAFPSDFRREIQIHS